MQVYATELRPKLPPFHPHYRCHGVSHSPSSHRCVRNRETHGAGGKRAAPQVTSDTPDGRHPVSCLSINRRPRPPSSELSAGTSHVIHGTNRYQLLRCHPSFPPKTAPRRSRQLLQIERLGAFVSQRSTQSRHRSLKQPSPQTSLAWFEHAFTEELCSLSRRAWGVLTNIPVSHHG